MKDGIKTKLILLSPVITTMFSWCANRFLLTLLSLAAVFICISICSPCRRHENLWLFVLVGISTIPANIEISIYACGYFSYLWGEAPVLRIIYFPLAYAILLCIEEILLGIIGRFIWKNQDPLFDEK